MLLNRSLGSGGVGYSLLLKGTGSCISAFMHVSKTTNSCALPGKKKKKQNHKRGECFSCQKNVWLNSSQETANGQPGLDWSAAAQIFIWRKCLRDVWKLWSLLKCAGDFTVPPGALRGVKCVVALAPLEVSDEGGTETCQRQIKFPRFSGVVARYGSH